MLEDEPRLSRTAAGLLVALAGLWGCTLDRTGLNGGGTTGDAHDDAPGHGGAGGIGATGAGGQGTAGSGGGGIVGIGGAAGAADDDGSVTDAIDANNPPDVAPDLPDDVPADVRPDLGIDTRGTDVGPDRPVVDAQADAVCGATALCANGAVTVILPGGRFTGATSGASTDHGSCGGDNAPEAAYKLVLTERSDVFVTTHGTTFDTQIYMRAGCCGAEIACNDDADNRKTSALTTRGLAAGTYFIFVDGANGGAAGAFTVDIYATPATTNAADNCGSAARIANLPVTGSTCGLEDDFTPLMGCLGPPATTSEDAVYYFVLDATSTVVTFNTCTNTCIDTVLYLRDICTTSSSQKACNDNFCAPAPAAMCPVGPPTQSRTTATLGPGVHYLIVDSHVGPPTATCGAFTITPLGVPQ